MRFKENDLVYWNDPTGKNSQSGIIRSVRGSLYVIDGGNGGTIEAPASELEPM